MQQHTLLADLKIHKKSCYFNKKNDKCHILSKNITFYRELVVDLVIVTFVVFLVKIATYLSRSLHSRKLSFYLLNYYFIK